MSDFIRLTDDTETVFVKAVSVTKVIVNRDDKAVHVDYSTSPDSEDSVSLHYENLRDAATTLAALGVPFETTDILTGHRRRGH